MRSIAFWVGWLMVAALALVSADLQNQRDRALVDLAALRPRLATAESSLAACRSQARQLASRPVTICQPPAPCPTLGERIHSIWEGGR